MFLPFFMFFIYDDKLQLSTVHHLQAAFEEASLYSRYHPNKGYTWDFASNKACKCLKCTSNT